MEGRRRRRRKGGQAIFYRAMETPNVLKMHSSESDWVHGKESTNTKANSSAK